MGVNERKEREKRARRKEILEVARGLFLKRGYGQTTIEEIAEGAELGKGTIYNYFSGKESIYFGLLIDTLEVLRDELVVALEEGSVFEALQNASRAIRRFHARRHGLSEIILVQVDNSWSDYPTEQVQRHEKLLTEILFLIRDLMGRFCSEEGLEVSCPTESAVLLFAVEIGMFVLTRMAPPGLQSLVDENKVLQLAHMILVRGLFGLDPSDERYGDWPAMIGIPAETAARNAEKAATGN